MAPKDPSKAGSPSSQGGTPSPPPGRPIGHQFVAISYSIGSVQCHVCFKSLDNRPALRCEICNVAVHDVHSCRDQIADCTKFKTLLNKVGWLVRAWDNREWKKQAQNNLDKLENYGFVWMDVRAQKDQNPIIPNWPKLFLLADCWSEWMMTGEHEIGRERCLMEKQQESNMTHLNCESTCPLISLTVSVLGCINITIQLSRTIAVLSRMIATVATFSIAVKSIVEALASKAQYCFPLYSSRQYC